MKIDPALLPVMKANCKTCPFREINGRMQDQGLANEVINRTLFKSHQICHSTEGKNRQPHNRCKGAFDYNFTVYERMGYGDLVK